MVSVKCVAFTLKNLHFPLSEKPIYRIVGFPHRSLSRMMAKWL